MSDDQSRQLVLRVASSATEAEKGALAIWATQLLEIRASSLQPLAKARQAIRLTMASKVILPTIKILSVEIKRRGWEERSWAARLGMAGATVGLVTFGTQAAGVAALGTAIGVPLWMVLGSGAAFAGVMIEEFSKKNPK